MRLKELSFIGADYSFLPSFLHLSLFLSFFFKKERVDEKKMENEDIGILCPRGISSNKKVKRSGKTKDEVGVWSGIESMGNINVVGNRKNFRSRNRKNLAYIQQCGLVKNKDAVVQNGKLTARQDWAQSHLHLQLATCLWVIWLLDYFLISKFGMSAH